MVGLVKSMVGWYRNRSLDPQVWERFLCYRLGPSLMPEPSELQLDTFIEPRLEQLQFEQLVNIINIIVTVPPLGAGD